jgi:hypothetical protein
MDVLNNWLIEVLFSDLAAATTAVAVFLSILQVIYVIRKWTEK